MSNPSARIDAFTDAAFAFAVSLMVVGAGGTALDYAALLLILKTIPSFAIGFAIIAMFWIAHVRWRGFRGEGDWRSVLLTIVLVFVVLVYVHPLRAMSSSFAAFLSGQDTRHSDYLGQIFTVYGICFTLMAAITSCLFLDALRNSMLSPDQRQAVKGESIIWGILVVTGIASTLLSLFPTTAAIAPPVYATLPLTIGLFVARWQWTLPNEIRASD